MYDGPADNGQSSGPAGERAPGRWQQRAGFSVFFDIRPAGPDEQRRRTRLYHEETGEETTFRGWEPADWVRWVLDRHGSAQPASGAAATASMVSIEIVDVRLAGDSVASAEDASVGAELRLRVTGIAELRRMTGAKVVGILFGPEPR
jgi:hypothetical protein